jgi:methionine-rich copper-binding protein CopC
MRCGYHRPLITCASKKHNVHAVSLHHCARLPGIWLVLPNGIFPSAMLSLFLKLIWKPADVWVLLRYMQEADNVQPHHHKASIPKNTATTKQVAVTTATLIKQASYIVGWRECAYTQTSRKPRSHSIPLIVAPFVPLHVRDNRCCGNSVALCGLYLASMDERAMDGQTMQNNERAKNPATKKQVAVTTATLIKQASYIVGWREIHAGAPSSLPRALLPAWAPACHASHLPDAAALR